MSSEWLRLTGAPQNPAVHTQLNPQQKPSANGLQQTNAPENALPQQTAQNTQNTAAGQQPAGALPNASNLPHLPALTPQQQATWLKTMLAMPPELTPLLKAWLTEGPGGNSKAAFNMLQAFTPEALAQPLLGKLNEGLKKIQQQLASSGGLRGPENETLQGALKQLTQLSGQTRSQPGQALQALITLMIPWQPLEPPQAVKIQAHRKNANDLPGAAGEAGDSDESSQGGGQHSLSIYLETRALGRLKLTLLEETPAHASQFQIVAKAMPALPDNIRADLEAHVAQKLSQASHLGQAQWAWPDLKATAQHNTAELMAQTPPMAPLAQMTTEPPEMPQQEFAVLPSGQITARLMSAASLIVNALLLLDNRIAHSEK
ncbi:MAG: hypothetical protein VKJ06_08505 [Vampirovibrionales bacterium]|nr:hypothetical protein [Vampirovibrionales bacterium]